MYLLSLIMSSYNSLQKKKYVIDYQGSVSVEESFLEDRIQGLCVR